MSLVVFGVAWIVTWALCWWPLNLVWPPRRHYSRTVRETTTAATPAPGPGQFGGRTYEAGPLKSDVRGARAWAGLIATVVAVAVSAATGGLFS